MKNEDKQLLLKDLCARLPYGVKGRYCLYDSKGNLIDWGNEPEIVENIDLQREKIWTDDTIQGYNIEEQDFKPYLRPMSSMTEDEKKEFDKLINLVEERCINAYGKGGYSLTFTELNDWLNAHQFDYRGLISMGLALKASEDMYKID